MKVVLTGKLRIIKRKTTKTTKFSFVYISSFLYEDINRINHYTKNYVIILIIVIRIRFTGIVVRFTTNLFQ